MKRLFAILASAAFLSGLCSCVRPDADYVHDDATISAIYLCTTQKDASGKDKPDRFQGAIDQDAGTILFSIPFASRRDIDLDAVKIRANVGYDAFVKVKREAGKSVDRTLYGIHDISEGIEITVTARMTGRTKDYFLKAKYETSL